MSGPGDIVSNCTGKERFETAASAQKAARGMGRARKKVRHYVCTTCGGWHIGRHHGHLRRPDHKLISNGAPRKSKVRLREFEIEEAGA